MNTKIFAFLALVVVVVTGCRTPKGASVSEKRSYVFEMRDEVLA